MKAIIMAGGQGSRLRPLTCSRPKPMMPVMNRPIMEHIVNLLKKHNLKNIGVTLQYLPEAIKDYFGSGVEFGVSMRYFIEEVPLGTAGSVKNTAGFLDETFMVISGDALTDFDLTKAVNFHKQKGAVATLVLTRVKTPLEYGVVITERDGRITRFLEKPGWSEVFSDTVNTGIYILEPEVLDYFQPGQKFDFSKDLFPRLLKDGKPMYGVVLEGYWCDIGDLWHYLRAHRDVLAGKVEVSIPGREIRPRVWVGEGVSIHPSAAVNGPVLIGDGCDIGPNAKIEPYTVLGEGCRVEERASIKKSVLCSGVYLGAGSSLRGAVLGSGVKVYSNASIYEGVVVGDHSTIKERVLVKPDVKLWPNKLVETGATVQRNIIWGAGASKNIYGLEGITGLANVEITPEFASRVGAAYGSTLSFGERVMLTSDSYPVCKMIKEAFTAGLQSMGVRVLDAGAVVTPVHRYAVRKLECKAGVHIKISSLRPDKINMVFTNSRGGNISRGEERKIENKLAGGDYRRADAGKIIPVEPVPGTAEAYLEDLERNVDMKTIARAGYKVVLAYDNRNLDKFIAPITLKAGVAVETAGAGGSALPLSWRSYKAMLPELGRAVVDKGADAGAVIDPNGDSMILVDEKGRVVQDDMLTALLALVVLKERGGPVVVPVTAPRAIEDMAVKYNGTVVRTKTAVRDLLEQIIVHDNRQKEKLSQFLLNFDAVAAFIKVLEFCARKKIGLSALVEEIPAFFVAKKQVPVSWEAKGRVIRKLIEEKPGKLELLDGVKVYHPQGWALVLPDPEEPLCRIYSEGSSMEIARELTDMYIDKINKIAGES
ncbi:mannose-1-phosphate guanylyltransferase/phosphomannomutase [Desulfohalotomaculum tongense]|uniref:mannose-1-phosphate guanyltransferase n=1 Tax=Desulforadius tongensis TaxID=1216062 RepID=UPI00195611EF|nr:mannose-1-phosphate guanyltransferase [Desulforadius tongensis]MBM7854989.1 mannose-1-phosphate guanylyltransferase/phosphomannomutase [Desulforadius tongensis]